MTAAPFSPSCLSRLEEVDNKEKLESQLERTANGLLWESSFVKLSACMGTDLSC